MTSFSTDTPPTRMIDVGHARAAYYRFGEGPDLLFVHGWPLHAATFRHVVDAWRDRYTCHVIDLPGSGRSEWGPDSKLSLSAHADSVEAVAERLQLDGFGLIGHDSGGLVARKFAAQTRRRVNALVLSGTEIPGHHPWQVTAFVSAARWLGAPALDLFLRAGPLRRARFGLGGCFVDPGYGEGEFFELFVRPLLDDRRCLQGQVEVLRAFDGTLIDTLDADHASISAPTLLIWGTEDPFFPVDRARNMVGQFAGPARFETIEGGRLLVHEDCVREYLDHADPFIDEWMSPARRAAAG